MLYLMIILVINITVAVKRQACQSEIREVARNDELIGRRGMVKRSILLLMYIFRDRRVIGRVIIRISHIVFFMLENYNTTNYCFKYKLFSNSIQISGFIMMRRRGRVWENSLR